MEPEEHKFAIDISSSPGTSHSDKILTYGTMAGPLSLVSTTEELLDRKVAAPV
jgi:hypothetical protein